MFFVINFFKFDFRISKYVGELQTRNFNTIPRGLCAVVCYYEAHRHFITILKMLLRLKSTADEMMPSVLGDLINKLLNDINFFKRILR